MTWPAPFSGITHFARFQDADAIASFIGFVAGGCGERHAHNLAVAFDGVTVHGSELLMECATRWQTAGEDEL